jgi:hypothetical protein
MALINMERPKPDKTENKVAEPMGTDSYYEKYPWGLRLSLNNDELTKLGFDITSIKAGDVGEINAKIIFTEVRSVDKVKEDGSTKKDNSIDIQITDLEVISANNFEKAFNEASEE